MNSLENSRILVIGGAGFIGSHVVKELLAENVAEVIIFDNFCRGKMENIAQSLKDPRCSIYPHGGDIRDVDILDDAMKGIDYVVHLAALWLLHCKDFPRSAFKANIEGTFNVLEACVKHKVKKLVYSSSASVYGDAVEVPMNEDHPFNNRNFYGATKIAGEAMLRAYHYRFGLNYVGLRYMNVYGPRQDYHGAYMAVIMRMLDAIDRGEQPTILGDGTEAFDFVAASDCGRANVCAMKADTVDRYYNVGTGGRTSLAELAEALLRLTDAGMEVKYEPRSEATLVTNRIGCPQRAEDELGFTAATGLDDGLSELIRWRSEQPGMSAGGAARPVQRQQS